jgi:pilus assembly protein Flp/PilA
MPEGEAGKHMSNKITLRKTVDLMRQFLANDRGATAIEYALIACGVGAAIASTVFSFGSNLKSTFYDKIAAML